MTTSASAVRTDARADARTDAGAPQGAAPLTAATAHRVATVLKAMADPLRLRIVAYVARSAAQEACVCDLMRLADVSQPTVSHHLKVLRDAGLLRCERRGTWVWYALAPGYAAPVVALLDNFASELPALNPTAGSPND